MMKLRFFLLSCLMMTVSACMIQKTPAHQENTKQTETEQPSNQYVAMETMDTGFLYLASQSAMKEGNHALAISLLEALIKKDPEAIDPHIQLTTLLLTTTQTDKAKTHLDALLATKNLQSGQLEQIQLLRIRLYLAESQAEKALDAISDFLKKHPSHIQARDLQARIFSSQKRFDEALAAVNSAIRKKDLPEFRQLQAQLLIKKGDIPSAKTALRRMQELSPDDETPVIMLSALALKGKNPAEAEKVLRAFLAGHPDALNINLALGKLMVQEKRLDEAIIVYREIATRTASNPEILRQLGILYFQHQDYTEAEATFRKLADIHPDDINRFYLAASLEALDKIPEARKTYEQINSTSSIAIDTQIRLAAIDISQAKLDTATKRLKNILKTKPQHLDAHLMLSAIRLNQKRYRELLDETDQLMGINKLPARLLFNRAVAFEHFRQYEQSEAMLNRIIQRHPDNAEALNFLGYTYAVQGVNLDRAIALINRALIQKPDDGYYLDSLAWAYYQGGKYAQAASTQTRALQQVTDDAVMHDHYGDIMWKNGKHEAARQAWQKAIELKFEHPEQLKRKIKEGLE